MSRDLPGFGVINEALSPVKNDTTPSITTNQHFD